VRIGTRAGVVGARILATVWRQLFAASGRTRSSSNGSSCVCLLLGTSGKLRLALIILITVNLDLAFCVVSVVRLAALCGRRRCAATRRAQAFQVVHCLSDEWMREGLLGRHPDVKLPFNTFVNEVYKVLIVAVEQRSKVFVVGQPHLALAVGYQNRLVVVIEEDFSSRCPGQHRSWWNALHLHNHGHVLLLILSWEERIADIQLVEDTAETPHVNGCVVWDAQDNFWRSVEPRLNVGVDLLVLEAARTEVDNLNSRFVNLSKQNVLRFEITMDNVMLSHVVQ